GPGRRVKTPGRLSLKQRDTLLTALAMAGGPTENADLLQAYVARDASVLPVNFRRLLFAKESSQNVLLQDKDFIYIPDVRDNRVFVLGEVVRPGDRLRPQLVELTVFALTLLGPSGGVATNLIWASATRADRTDSVLCACPRERHDNSSTSA